MCGFTSLGTRTMSRHWQVTPGLRVSQLQLLEEIQLDASFPQNDLSAECHCTLLNGSTWEADAGAKQEPDPRSKPTTKT